MSTIRVTGRRVLTVGLPSFRKPRNMLVYTTDQPNLYIGWIDEAWMQEASFRSGWYAFKLYSDERDGSPWTMMVVIGEAESDQLPSPPPGR